MERKTRAIPHYERTDRSKPSGGRLELSHSLSPGGFCHAGVRSRNGRGSSEGSSTYALPDPLCTFLSFIVQCGATPFRCPKSICARSLCRSVPASCRTCGFSFPLRFLYDSFTIFLLSGCIMGVTV